MSDSHPTVAGTFRPRTRAITATGILLALIGLMLGGLSLLSVVQAFAMSKLGDLDPKVAEEMKGIGEMMWSLSLVNLVVYGGLGLLFVMVAWACLTFRRWARPFALTLSWGWCYTGVIMSLSLLATMPAMKETLTGSIARAGSSAPNPASAPDMGTIYTVIMVGYLVIILLFMILLPALLLWLNLGDDVRLTLESRDPVSRWTDHLPLPLVGMTIAATVFAVMSLPSLIMMKQPWMKSFLPQGALGTLFYGIPLAWGYIAWGTYHRQRAAWGLAVLVLLGGTALGLTSMRDLDWISIYRDMGIPGTQVEEMAAMMDNLFSPGIMGVLMGFSLLPILGFLIWVLRFFRQSNESREHL